MLFTLHLNSFHHVFSTFPPRPTTPLWSSHKSTGRSHTALLPALPSSKGHILRCCPRLERAKVRQRPVQSRRYSLLTELVYKKRPHRKVKSGCQTCKRRKIKVRGFLSPAFDCWSDIASCSTRSWLSWWDTSEPETRDMVIKAYETMDLANRLLV